MLDQLKRWIFFYDIKIDPSTEIGPSVEMSWIVDNMINRQKNGDSVKLLNNNTAAMRITDMRVDKKQQVVILLLQYSDMSVADPAFGELETGKIRVEPKLEGEGIAVSAHFAIALEPAPPLKDLYLCLLEEVPGISKSKIDPFINYELKHSCRYTFYDEDGKIKQCRPVCKMFAHPSQSLIDDLERGELKHIELISLKNKEDEFDEKGYTEEIYRGIKLRLKKRCKSSSTAYSLLKNIGSIARNEGYNEMRVTYHRLEGKDKTVPLSTIRDDAKEKLFTRMEVCALKTPLDQCSEAIDEGIANFMIEKIHDEKKRILEKIKKRRK